MKKITFWSILMLLSLSMSLVACGSDGEEETDEQKFFRLTNIKEENFDDIIRCGWVSENCLEFAGFEKDTEVFHLWIYNRITNKITEYKKQVEKSYQVYEGYGDYGDYQLRKQHVGYTNDDTKVGKLLQFEIGYYDSEGNLKGRSNLNFLFNKNEQIILLNEPEFYLSKYSYNKYATFEWYNNSLAFEFAKGYSTNSNTSGNLVFLAAVVIVSQEGQIVKTLNNSVNALTQYHLVEYYNYDRALYWGFSFKKRKGESIIYSDGYDDYLVIYFLDLNKELTYENFGTGRIIIGGFGILFNDFEIYKRKENCKYETEIISSDSRYCTFRITEINYQGERKEVVIKADKQNETAEIVN